MSQGPVNVANASELATLIATAIGSSPVDREIIVTSYRANKAGTGFSSQDLIQSWIFYNVVGTPSAVATIWINQTTGATIGTPSFSDIDYVEKLNQTKLILNGSDVTTSNRLPTSDGNIPTPQAVVPSGLDSGIPIRQVPTKTYRVGFSSAVSGDVDSDLLTRMGSIPAGMTVNQTGGNLVITTGTNTNEEFLARSLFSFNGAFAFDFVHTQSARPTNNQTGFWLADLIGEGLSYTINSSTSITVSGVQGAWSSKNVGQSMNLSASALSGFIAGRYTIASVSGSSLTFTVSGFPASGSGTLTLWGWNAFLAQAQNATTTNLAFTSYRKGIGLAVTQATTTAITSGYIASIISDGRLATLGEGGTGTQTSALSARASRFQAIVDDDVNLYVFLQVLNGTSAPSVTSTWTVDFFAVEDVPNNKVFLSQTSRSPFNFVTIASTANVQGANNSGSGTLGSPVMAGAEAKSALRTAVTDAQTTRIIADLRARLIFYGSQVRELQSVETTTITASTTETTIGTAVASVLKDIKGLLIANTSATGIRVDIRDATAGTIRLSPWIPANTTVFLGFTEPLKQATANNNWTAQCSASVTDIRIMLQTIQS